jgi:hypothetical protein
MFITSRESAIFPYPVPYLPRQKLPVPFFRPHGLTLEDLQALHPYPRAFGVPSIYQPGKTPPPSEFPVFIGFFKVFLDRRESAIPLSIYMLWY